MLWLLSSLKMVKSFIFYISGWYWFTLPRPSIYLVLQNKNPFLASWSYVDRAFLIAFFSSLSQSYSSDIAWAKSVESVFWLGQFSHYVRTNPKAVDFFSFNFVSNWSNWSFRWISLDDPWLIHLDRDSCSMTRSKGFPFRPCVVNVTRWSILFSR